MDEGRLVDIGDTRLWVVERGDPGGLPLILLHGGPGLDHHAFGHWLDPLGADCRLVLVDQRAEGRSDRDAPPETWSLEQKARDIDALAAAIGLERYVVLGHSFGALVALQHAVDTAGGASLAAATILHACAPHHRYFDCVEPNLAAFEPIELREQVTASWAAEANAHTEEDVRRLLADQTPFHFADPLDPRIAEVGERFADARFNADVIRAAATNDYGAIDVEDQLGVVTEPVLVIAGRHDRVCSIEASEAIVDGIPGAELVVLEQSAHLGHIEETDRFNAAVSDFIRRRVL